MFYLWLRHTKYYFFTEGWDDAYLLIRCQYLLLLAYRVVPLLIISSLARQPLTKLIVLNFTRYSSRKLFHFTYTLYHDPLIRAVPSLVQGISLNKCFFVCRYLTLISIKLLICIATQFNCTFSSREFLYTINGK